MKIPPRFLVVLAACLGFTFAAKAAPLKVGDSAPAVTGITETGVKLNLGDFYKQQPYTLVYFYPRAGTSGCTKQGCSLRDAYEALTKRGVAVIGVSTDTAEAQEKFKDAQHFPFTLIADPDKKVIGAFGVPTHSVATMGTMASRQAFLIKDGKIIWADYHAATTQQAADVLKVLDEQKS